MNFQAFAYPLIQNPSIVKARSTPVEWISGGLLRGKTGGRRLSRCSDLLFLVAGHCEMFCECRIRSYVLLAQNWVLNLQGNMARAHLSKKRFGQW